MIRINVLQGDLTDISAVTKSTGWHKPPTIWVSTHAWFQTDECGCRLYRYELTWFPTVIQIASKFQLILHRNAYYQYFCFSRHVPLDIRGTLFIYFTKLIFIGSKYPKDTSFDFENRITAYCCAHIFNSVPIHTTVSETSLILLAHVPVG